MIRMASLPGMILLAACTGSPAQADSRDQAVPVSNQATLPATGDPAPATPAATAAPAPPVDDESGTPGIPAEFGGVWTLEGSSCATDSDGRLEVTADTLRFYDASAMPRGVQVERRGKARLDLAFESGSEIWRELAEFELIDGGKRLQQTTGGAKMLYTRCPNESTK